MAVRFISDRRISLAKGAGALAFALFCVLAIAMMHRAGWLEGLNRGLMGAAGLARDTGLGGPVTMVMRLASAIGGTAGRLALVGVVVLPLLWFGRRRAAGWLVATIAGGTLLNLGLKQLFAAPRPDLLPHLDMVNSYSFPSGHAAGNMMFFGAVAMLAGARSGYWAAAAIIALIGISRVWLGVHWPSDVTAGWIEGLGWLAFCAVWLPARGGEQQRAADALMRRHPVAGDETMDPETVDHRAGGDQQ
ncbi:phosphatase PAP2 family protein [Sphingobium sp. HBC34]|uniref:Phosphatase PAP2 family protein n=1 Tax=Sphingobium cyanobacteriorum TaxID=3063954 RepID=A0ABT8ZML8_9SPHN|nr:phosphatase PAP2 family protein [Sphingobium sp. HBC34]MDO7835432.1 phosphatase PAP2 family protein [Sphingobium sp. HBC34]